MTALSIHNLSHQFDDGVSLFSGINVALEHPLTGLIGDNGSGKSTLVSMLKGEIVAPSGYVDITPSVHWVAQHEDDVQSQQSIADYLGVAEVLSALNKIRTGDCSTTLFDIVGDQWQLEEELQSTFARLGLPCDSHLPISALSGGQRAKLRLYLAFNSQANLLVLDEPSNHLDAPSKQWLLDLIHDYDGHILLISHDRMLLSDTNAIWSMENQSIRVFGGGYDAFITQQQKDAEALSRQINAVEKQQNRLAKQRTQNQIKAQKRAQQGEKLRKSSSQSKCLLDAKKESADHSASNRARHHDNRRLALNAKQQELKKQQVQSHAVKLYTAQVNDAKRTAFSIDEGVLAYGSSSPIQMQLKANEKVRLIGPNGIGKSLLLNTLLGIIQPKYGAFRVNSPMFMLDQYYSVLRPELNILQNLELHCPHLNESDSRTLLAGIGFRGKDVFRLTQSLSGGERMKLAVTAVCHQQNQPFLLLDEPDNHLDITSKNALANALFAYKSGFLLVSHDDAFARDAGITHHVTLR